MASLQMCCVPARLLFARIAFVRAVPPVPMEEVHQRASQQEQIGPITRNVRPVFPEQEECPDECKHDHCANQFAAASAGVGSFCMPCGVVVVHGDLQEVVIETMMVPVKTIGLNTVAMSSLKIEMLKLAAPLRILVSHCAVHWQKGPFRVRQGGRETGLKHERAAKHVACFWIAPANTQTSCLPARIAATGLLSCQRPSEHLHSPGVERMFYCLSQALQGVRVDGCPEGTAGRPTSAVVERGVSMWPAASTLTMPSLG